MKKILPLLFAAFLLLPASGRASDALGYRSIGPRETIGRIHKVFLEGDVSARRAAGEEFAAMIEEKGKTLEDPASEQFLSLAGDSLVQLLWSGNATTRVRVERLMGDMIYKLGTFAYDRVATPERAVARKLLTRFAGVLAIKADNASCQKLGEQVAEIFQRAKAPLTAPAITDLVAFTGEATPAAAVEPPEAPGELTAAPAQAESAPAAAQAEPPPPTSVPAETAAATPTPAPPESAPAAVPAPGEPAEPAAASAATPSEEKPVRTAVADARPAEAETRELPVVPPPSPAQSAIQVVQLAPAPLAKASVPPVAVTTITIPARGQGAAAPSAPPAAARPSAPPAAQTAARASATTLRIIADQLRATEERPLLSALQLTEKLSQQVQSGAKDDSNKENVALSHAIMARIRDLLGSRNLEVRQTAARLSGMFQDPLAVQSLIQLLQDNDQDLRSAAAESLERITGQKFGQDAGKWSAWKSENPS